VLSWAVLDRFGTFYVRVGLSLLLAAACPGLPWLGALAVVGALSTRVTGRVGCRRLGAL